jgi:hypothetical protein
MLKNKRRWHREFRQYYLYMSSSNLFVLMVIFIVGLAGIEVCLIQLGWIQPRPWWWFDYVSAVLIFLELKTGWYITIYRGNPRPKRWIVYHRPMYLR